MSALAKFPTLTVSEETPKIFVRLEGEAGPEEAEQLDVYFQILIDRKPRLVMIDVSGLTSFSSKAVVALVKLQRALDRLGSRVLLIDPPEAMAEVLQAIGLENFFAFA